MNELATVAVVVPCNNVAHIVDQCIKSLVRQDYPQDKFSIIAVNDGSTDSTKEHLEFFKTHPNFYFFNHDKNKGLSAARNTGIENSQSEIVCFLDSDMVIQPNWLQLIVAELMTEEVIGVIGNTTLPKGEESNLLDHYFYSAQRGARQFGESSAIGWRWFLFNNTAVKRSAIKKTGLFDEKFTSYGGEDTDMAIRLWHNFPDALRFSSKINAEHHHKRTLNQFCKQMEIYGQTNLPLLLDRYPEYNKELAGDLVTTWRGRFLFNALLSKLLRLINIILPNITITRYLVIYSVICGARKAYYRR